MPTLRIIAYTLEINVPYLYSLSRFFLKKAVRKMIERGFEQPAAVDSQLFAKYRKYLIYLFQLTS